MWIADPICAFIISVLILLSVFPLVNHSSRVLLHYVPEGKESLWQSVKEAICAMEGVRGIASPQFFVYTGDETVCSMHILVVEGKEMEVWKNVKALLEQVGIHDSVVQVTSRGREEDYEKFVSSGTDPNRVIRSFMENYSHHDHDHDHEHEHEHGHNHNHSFHHSHSQNHAHSHSHAHSDDSDDHSHDSDDHSHDSDDSSDDHFHPPASSNFTQRSRKLLVSSGKLD